MAEVEEITYTPEELQEIDRIVELVGTGGRKVSGGTGTAPKVPTIDEWDSYAPQKTEEEYHAAPESFTEPEDLSLPSVDLDALTSKKKPSVPEEEAPVEDITGLLQEVQEEEPAAAFEAGGGLEEIPEQPAPAAEKPGELSALDELDNLTMEEPESLDLRDRAPSDTFIQERKPVRAEKAAPPEKRDEGRFTADLAEPDVFAAPPLESEKPQERVAISREPESGIPDLSEISFDEKFDMPEARESDIPEIDMGAAETEEPAPIRTEPAESARDIGELTDDDFASIKEAATRKDEIEITPSKKIISELKQKESVRDMSPDPGMDIPDLPAMEEPLEIEMLEEETRPEKPEKPAKIQRQQEPAPQAGFGIDLTDRELKRLQRAILLFQPSVRQTVKDVVLNDLLPLKDTRALINMILSGRPESEIHKYLEGKLKKTISFGIGRAVPGRRVITSRPEYTREGRERQQRLLTFTKIFGAAAAVACILVVVGYQFIYKPYAAKSMIQQGAALIRESGDYLKKPKDYARAEKMFRDVDENYVKDYAYGYLEYSRAYFDKKEYLFSIEKLNAIYAIQSRKGRAHEADLLNGLGRFYSKVPAEFYNSVRLNINRWYYPGRGKKREEWSQLDVAIEFYRRTLLRDAGNIDALYGIGNAYFFQGQYFKAKKYFEDIVGLEPDSEVGYSGLLNLYIERDVFEKVIDVHSQLNEKNLMEKVPSALLAKLASYYLDKQKSATANVRVDYGVQSPRFKDTDDNIFPAVYGVLEALNKRDPDYPPLHLQYARLNRAQKNLKVMRIHLDKAIELSRKNYGAEYFGALELLGEYYYQSKEPVKAYETLNRAIKAASTPPEFTHEDFYRETESVGKSHALLGNIFYYYFDKVRMRYGDLEDEEIEQEPERLVNYQIARDKYEKALEEGFESAEVHYNLGRIYYLNKLYRKALDQWLNLYDDFVENPEIMFALGNAFYHMGNYEAAKGEYLKLISVYEHELERSTALRPGNESNVKMVQFLSSAYNNLGAVYQLRNNEAKSDISYWKAIDNAQRIYSDNEFARVNLARSFRQTGEPGEPILDESIPYSIEYYREDKRS